MTDRAEELTADLNSGDPGRIQRAIEALENLMLSLETIPLPRPPAKLFAPFDEGDHDDAIASYIGLLAHYPFEPPLDAAERTRRAIDAVLEHGQSYAARQLTLKLVIPSPFERTGPALDYIARRGVRPGREAEQASWILSYLLDHVPTRPETVAALRKWMKTPVLKDVVANAARRFSDEERATLERWAQPG